MKQLKNISCFLLILSFCANAQENMVEKAKDNFDNYAFYDAVEGYEELLEKGYSSEEIYKKLGNANYFNAQYDAASEWYGKLFELEDAVIDAAYMYKYAQCLKSLKKYEESDTWMQKFATAKTLDKRAALYVKNKNYLEKIKAQSGRYGIKNLALNSDASDFAPSFYGEKLVFATARDTGITTRKSHLWNKSPFLNLYSADSSENGDYASPYKFSKALNTKAHESSSVFTKDGKTLYFTRNNYKNRRFARDKDGLSRLKVYRATWQDGEWGDVTELPFNNDDYSVAHPALSTDEKTLYFASDMPGTMGESDIFSVSIEADGSYGVPINLGNKVNTEARETFPFISALNVLYFASDGHPGLGGLDVYATKLDDMDAIYVVNVGEPINSEEDDFSYVVNEGTKKGFFTSNRAGGKGDDDIYGFIEKEALDLACNTRVEGIVKDKETDAPLNESNVAIYNGTNELVSEIVTDENGKFSLEVDCKNATYTMIASKQEYDNADTVVNVKGADDIPNVEIALVKTLRSAPVGTDLVQLLSLEPIYFDLDKADIRPDASETMTKVIDYLKQFPEVQLQVQSHTDVRGSDDYNMRLSNRRAESTVAYLLANGIDSGRITGKGFGETQLTNECTTRESCSDDRHEKNRRSVFIVLK